MIYGAYGYTGRLITELAVARRGINPIIAGRNAKAIGQLAKANSLQFEQFELLSVDELAKRLTNIDVFLNCAGPFSATAAISMEACIKSKTHYLDITGEIDVYELAYDLNERAIESGVVLCPGVGFDVIPTDCLALLLKRELPTANKLTLSFYPMGGKLSPGTVKTGLEGISKGGRIRVDGKIISVPLGHQVREVDFGYGNRSTVSISWGDISTAFYSSGIPNISVYFPVSEKSIKRLIRRRKYAFLLGFKPIQNLFKIGIGLKVKGATTDQRNTSRMLIWGEVQDNDNNIVTGVFETGDGYDVTAMGAIEAVNHLLLNSENSGYYTPGLLLGTSILQKLPGYSGIKFKREKKINN